VTARRVKNNRLAAVGFVWAFASIPRPGPAKDLYDCRRARGDRHAAALRNVYNRFLGQLYHCLQAGQTYNQAKAYRSPLEQARTSRRLTSTADRRSESEPSRSERW